jgi:hypothetical protein
MFCTPLLLHYESHNIKITILTGKELMIQLDTSQNLPEERF